MFDLVIRGGDIATPQGVVRGDTAVARQAIAVDGSLSAEAREVIAVSGQAGPIEGTT